VDADFEDWARARTPSLLRAAYLLTGSQQAAEDLVQGALEKVAIAWRRIDGYPEAYARQVLYRLHLRSWRRRRVVEIITSSTPERGAGDQTAAVDLRVTVETALRLLTPAQRAVLVLRYYEDLSETDTAALLRCSIGTVKSQSHKALQSLRQKAPELAELVGRRLPTDA
jgi:RNA polymerase sigma-70 factor (sigma-E family)